METFHIRIIGLFDTVVFVWSGEAKDKYHAFKIAGAIFDSCFKRCEVVSA